MTCKLKENCLVHGIGNCISGHGSARSFSIRESWGSRLMMCVGGGGGGAVLGEEGGVYFGLK